MLDESIRFKFQSDSINTTSICIKSISKSCFKFQSDSINTDIVRQNTDARMSFKFQSDSINTEMEIKLI